MTKTRFACLPRGARTRSSSRVERDARDLPEARTRGIDDLAALNALYRPGPIDSGMVRRLHRPPPRSQESDVRLPGDEGHSRSDTRHRRLSRTGHGVVSTPRWVLARRGGHRPSDHGQRARPARQASEALRRRGRGSRDNRAKLEKLWQMLEGFADYAFNKSHSVAYALLAYQTAYLKAHHPTHFWAAVLSNELDNTDKVAKYIGELRADGIEVLPPDVNISNALFTPRGATIRFGLVAIKGLGQSAVSAILDARREGGPFRSMHQFCERVDSRAVNKRVLERPISRRVRFVRCPSPATLRGHRLGDRVGRPRPARPRDRSGRSVRRDGGRGRGAASGAPRRVRVVGDGSAYRREGDTRVLHHGSPSLAIF